MCRAPWQQLDLEEEGEMWDADLVVGHQIFGMVERYFVFCEVVAKLKLSGTRPEEDRTGMGMGCEGNGRVM